ncbi:10807_t:CDS:2, partial [Racocetra fulgida]
LATSQNIEEHISTAVNLNNNNDEDIFAKMWADDQILVKDEVTHYLCYPNKRRNLDSLIWWQGHQSKSSEDKEIDDFLDSTYKEKVSKERIREKKLRKQNLSSDNTSSEEW